jgi:hypothetical protein
MRSDKHPLFLGNPSIGSIHFQEDGAVTIDGMILRPEEQIADYALGGWRIDFRDGTLWIRTNDHVHCFQFNPERKGWDYSAEQRRGSVIQMLLFATILWFWWFVLNWLTGS